MIVDSGPADLATPGLVAYRPCGCAVDFLADAAASEFRERHLKAWIEQGFRSEAMPYGEAAERIREGAACSHSR